MEILANKVVRFTNAFNPHSYIDIIEQVSDTVYPLIHTERRPHLTMELPTLFSRKDNLVAARLRSMCLSDMLSPITQYMSVYNIEKMVPKKDFITVSKLIPNSSMEAHVDDKEAASDNFICMAYINDNFTGGELNFPELGIRYKPSAGDIIIYQAKEKHEVLELTDGIRYTFGYGLRGPVND
jgi:hypothetical protein